MSLLSKQKQILGLVAWLLVSFAASAVGAVASIHARSFYGQLIQPQWAPPGSVFGPVWTTLYVLMAIAAWLVWRTGGFRAHRQALSIIFVAARVQRIMELAILCLAPGGSGARRCAGIVAVYPGHDSFFLARSTAGRCTARSLSALGELRIRAELFGLATESADSGLVNGCYLMP